MGLFSLSKKEPVLISESNRRFAEENLLSFAANLGTELFRRNGQLLPVYENFPFANLRDEKELHGLVRKIAEYIGLYRTDIRVQTYDKTELCWVSGFPYGQTELPDTAILVFIPGADQPYPEFFITTISLQLIRYKLSEIYGHTDLKYQSEIAADFFGLAISCVLSYAAPKSVPGSVFCQLSSNTHLYSLLLLIHISGDKREIYRSYLKKDQLINFDLLHQMLLDEDTYRLFSEEWRTAEQKYPLLKLVYNSMASDTEKIESYNELIRLEPDNASWYNNRGYSFLNLKNYNLAISDFDKAIDLDPYWSFPFNNRGFAYLNQGKLSRGKEDIETAFRLDGDNGYAKRNMGYYHFLKKEYKEALQCYSEAKKIQDKIEHIHYFTGLAFLALGETENARKEFDLSRALPELPVPEYPVI